MPDAARWDLLVKRDDLGTTEVRPAETPELAADQVELEVERFALSGNNVTYARFGDPPLNFWGVFPAADPAWGRLPVWAFVRVTRSRHADFAAGDRFFGLVPASSHHLVRPGPAPRGFLDTTPDRVFPFPWYQEFRAAGAVEDRDDRRTLLRPIFPASFHAAELLAGQAGGGGLTVLVTSASSKVAIGIAHRLRDNPDVRVVGLTSTAHREFTAAVGDYDEVVDYADVPALTVDGQVACFDLSGDNDLVTALHSQFRDGLVYIGRGGWTHGAQPPAELGDRPLEDFFAPAIEGATIEAEGADAFFARYLPAEDEFVDSSEAWLTLEHARGPEAVEAVFGRLVDGSHPADTGTILSP